MTTDTCNPDVPIPLWPTHMYDACGYRCGPQGSAPDPAPGAPPPPGGAPPGSPKTGPDTRAPDEVAAPSVARAFITAAGALARLEHDVPGAANEAFIIAACLGTIEAWVESAAGRLVVNHRMLADAAAELGKIRGLGDPECTDAMAEVAALCLFGADWWVGVTAGSQVTRLEGIKQAIEAAIAEGRSAC